MFFGPCEFCYTAPETFNISSDSARTLLLHTNRLAMQSYWLDNVITVGLRGNLTQSLCDSSMVFNFYADTAVANNCDTSSFGSLGNPLVTLNCYSGDELDIIAPFANADTLWPGDTVLIFVHCDFANGESIHDCITTIVPTNSDPLQSVTIDLRGKLGIITPNSTYRIKIYRL